MDRLCDAFGAGEFEIDTVAETLPEGCVSERRAFIKLFVREIEVNGTLAMLRYNTPLQINGIEANIRFYLFAIMVGKGEQYA